MSTRIQAGRLLVELQGSGQASAWLEGRPLTEGPLSLFELTVIPWGSLASTQFEWQTPEQGRDGERELLSLSGRHPKHPVAVRVGLLQQRGALTFTLSVAVDWPDTPLETFLHSPFLAGLSLPGAQFRYPANPLPKPQGDSALKLHPAFPLPLCFFDEAGDGLSLGFETAWPGLGWDQCRNQELDAVANEREWREHMLRLRPNGCLSVALEARMLPLSEGWAQAFEDCRKRVQDRIELSEYAREDLKWLRGCQFQHFTYTYGREACGAAGDRIDVEGLLQAGEAFGGYDAVLLWHQYPRLGLDRRSQWDFYDDFPGGRAGLKQLVEQLHARGVRAFLPFKPWDAGIDETPRQAVEQMARLVIECEIDGIFFDTMDSVPEGLRALIDAGRPGVAFLTEGQPANPLALEQITGSWDQYWSEMPMPEVNALRFLMPMHDCPIIARWHLGGRKDLLIDRAVFGGVGIILWQDIFGAWLPYSGEQKARIARWKRLFMKYREAFQSPGALPLIPTRQDAIYANCFPLARERMYTLFNAAAQPVTGALIALPGPGRAEEVWAGVPVSVREGMLEGRIEPGQVLVVHFTADEEEKL